MHIHVLLFASLRERFGQGALELDLITATSVNDLWQQLSACDQRLPECVLCAVNQEFADHKVILRPFGVREKLQLMGTKANN